MTRIRFIAPLLLIVCCVSPQEPELPKRAATPGNDVLITKEQVTKMKVEVQQVDIRDVDDTVVTTGKVAFDDQKIVHEFSPVTGKAVRVIAQLGDHVKRGRPARRHRVAGLGVATSDFGKANADLIAAEHDYRRRRELLETHADLAARRRDRGRQLPQSEGGARARAAKSGALPPRLGDGPELPYDGRPRRRSVHEERSRRAWKSPVSTAARTPSSSSRSAQADKVWVFADLFELDVSRVKLGAKVVVNVASYPGKTFEGKVDWISGALDKDTHATKLRCSFDNADGSLQPEMFATVKIAVDQKKSLAIPRSSVLRFGDQTVVFLDRGPKDGKEHFERIPVTVDEGEGSEWLSVDPNRGINPATRS